MAATMMSILFVGLSAHLRGGLTVWSRATQTVERMQERRVALDRLERDLVNAVMYDDQETAYGTEEGKLPPPNFGAGALAFFTVAPATSRAPGSIRLVTYDCAQQEGVAGLWRASQSIIEARLHRPPRPQLIMAGCDAFDMAYAYRPSEGSPAGTLQWLPQWEEPLKGLPRLIRIALKLHSGEVLERVVLVPDGVLRSVEAAP